MNGTLSTYLTFWHVVVAFLAVVLGVVAIRISFTFDLNKYLESRRESYRMRLKNTCTHVILEPVDDGIQGRLLFVSPPGTLQWQCQRCGLIRYIENDEAEEIVRYWIGNPDEYNQRTKKFQKLLKKSGQA